MIPKAENDVLRVSWLSPAKLVELRSAIRSFVFHSASMNWDCSYPAPAMRGVISDILRPWCKISLVELPHSLPAAMLAAGIAARRAARAATTAAEDEAWRARVEAADAAAIGDEAGGKAGAAAADADVDEGAVRDGIALAQMMVGAPLQLGAGRYSVQAGDDDEPASELLLLLLSAPMAMIITTRRWMVRRSAHGDERHEEDSTADDSVDVEEAEGEPEPGSPAHGGGESGAAGGADAKKPRPQDPNRPLFGTPRKIPAPFVTDNTRCTPPAAGKRAASRGHGKGHGSSSSACGISPAR